MQKVSTKVKCHLFCDISLPKNFLIILPQGTHITVKHFGSITTAEGSCAVFLSPTECQRSAISLMLLSIHRNQKERNVTGFSDYILIFVQVVQLKGKKKNPTLSDAPDSALKMSPWEFFAFTSMNCFIAKRIIWFPDLGFSFGDIINSRSS